MKFQAKYVDNVYMLRNLKVTVSELQLSLASRSEIVEQSETIMVSSLDVQFYSEDRLGLGGADAQQESPDHYSCV